MSAIYRVTWAIDVLAPNPITAAIEALRIHRDPESIATVFNVTDQDGKTTEIDLHPCEECGSPDSYNIEGRQPTGKHHEAFCSLFQIDQIVILTLTCAAVLLLNRKDQ